LTKTLLTLAFLGLCEPLWAQCIVGVSQVPCDFPPVRTRIVAASGGHCTTVQQCVSGAQPGDLILVRAGAYTGAVNATVHGTAQRPIVLRGEPGAVLQPSSKTEADSVWLQGNFWILEGFEINGGWHAVKVDGRNVLLRNIHAHHGGRTGGQNALVLNSDVAILGGRIHHPGIGAPSPKLSHNVYVSDYYGRSVARVSVVGVELTDSPGAGVQVWNAAKRVTDVRIDGVRFARNVVDVTLTNVDRGTIANSTFTHEGGAPPSDWGISAWLYLTSNTALLFSGNKFTATTAGCSQIAGYSQALTHLWWTSNTWKWPTGCPVIDDAQLNRAGGH